MRAWLRPLLALFTVLVPLSGIPSVAAQANLVTYESPTYGFSVTWDDDVWNLDEDATLVAQGPAAVDDIRLVPGNGPALYITGADHGDTDAASCLRAESNRVANDPTISEYRPYVRADGTELAGEVDGVAFAAFQFLRTRDGEDPYQSVVYINCRLLLGSGVSVLFSLFAEVDLFEVYLAETERVMATLQVPAPTPEPDSTAAPGPFPLVDAAWFDVLVAAVADEPSPLGPLAGELVQSMESVSVAPVADNEQNFYLRANFENPSAADEAPWDFGFQFRIGEEDRYRLIITSEGTWRLVMLNAGTVQSGTLQSLALEEGIFNTLELVAIGDMGVFRLNGVELVGPLDLSALPDPGGVNVGAAFYAANTVPGAVTGYRDVELWSLGGGAPEPTVVPEPPPTAEPESSPTVDAAWFDAQVAAATAAPSFVGPLAGELVVDPGGPSFVRVADDEQNFYLRASFENPSVAVDAPWQFGVEFRYSATDDHHLLTIDSDSTWIHWPAASFLTTQFGETTSLALGAGDINTLELVAVGDIGAFRINGQELLGPLDLSSTPGSGTVSIGVGFYSDSLAGAVTPYHDVELWRLDAEAPVE